MIKEQKVENREPINKLIEDYKKIVEKTRLKKEVYKWEIVNSEQGKPDVNAPDFLKEIETFKVSNLTYQMAIPVLKVLAKGNIDKLRSHFIQLFDENIPLQDRITSFNKDTLSFYRIYESKLGHHQDERSISAYLTLHNPTKYTFYKSSFYKKYCKLIGVKEAKKNHKYEHYLSLINDLIENHIKEDQQLIELIKDCIPKYYDGTNHLLLAQDILFQTLDKEMPVNYWVFQGNPAYFDIKGSIKNGHLKTWAVKAHKAKIKPGDKVIIWVTGEHAGCYALATVSSEPSLGKSSEVELSYYTSPPQETEGLLVEITIDYALHDHPIFKEEVKENEVFERLKVGSQGTNFSATKEEYQGFLDYVKPKNIKDYEAIKAKLNQDDLAFFFEILREFIQKNNLTPDDPRISFNIGHHPNRLMLILGTRYSWRIKSIKKKTFTAFISKEKITQKETFLDRNKNIEAYFNEPENIKDYKKQILEGLQIELDRNNKCNVKGYESQDFVKEAFQLTSTPINQNYMAPSLNTILYGPPGTGKTYNTILRAAQIIQQKNLEDYDQALEIFKENLHERIEFITFHQNYSYEDFIQGLRPDTKNNQQLTFEKKDGVFKVIADKALANLYSEEPNQNYVIVIDEINRANISRVFGELITLIEPDKRSHGAIPLEARLPSGDSFIVPSNLFIIGTMNTADKSIALLDIALRRRFDFEAMYPLYQISGQTIHDSDVLLAINKKIIGSKGHDFQIGHAYFMGSNDDLVERINKKVIPLLMEYYMNDYDMVKRILKAAKLNVKDHSWPLKITGKND